MIEKEVLQEIREEILTEFDVSREIDDGEVREIIRRNCGQYAKRYMLTLAQRTELEQFLFYSIRKLDVLQELLDDDEITEIMVNGVNHIFYEKHGQLHEFEKTFTSKEKLEDTIQQIVGKNNRMINLSNPIVDTRLSDGSRVNIVLSPISIDGSAISIRKFPKKPYEMQDLIEMGAISQEAAEFLKKLVIARYNIFVSGGTGSGKTTFLNALSQFIPKEERIITIEDSAELQLIEKPNLVRLETRNVNMDGVTPISIRDLIRAALRMRPSMIIVGECRGGEALDVLQAMNTGHDGSLSTGHANSCRDMISRLETMVLMGSVELPLTAIRNQIASGIDIFVHLGRLRDKSRKVLSITEVLAYENGEIVLNELYRFCELEEKDGCIYGELKKTGSLQHKEKLKNAGMC
ncbi:MAG: CpaF family protein [Roseburia sp.]|nr:CpaF family protein [Roseburia sp.]